MLLISLGNDRNESKIWCSIKSPFRFTNRDVTEDELTNIFSAHGNIVQMNLLKDKITGMPRGVAFVRYYFLFIFFNQ